MPTIIEKRLWNLGYIFQGFAKFLHYKQNKMIKISSSKPKQRTKKMSF